MTFQSGDPQTPALKNFIQFVMLTGAASGGGIFALYVSRHFSRFLDANARYHAVLAGL